VIAAQCEHFSFWHLATFGCDAQIQSLMVARLDRDNPELAAEVRAGDLSAQP
jgi:hypothetical protein